MASTRFCAAALLGSAILTAPLDVDRPLIVNATIAREIGVGEIHGYSVTASAGQFLRIDIGQQALDLVGRVSDPSGHSLLEANNADHADRIVLQWIANAAGTYRIEVELRQARGREPYRLTLIDMRPARDDDRLRIRADRASREGHRLRLQGTAETLRASVAAFEEAIATWRELGDREPLAFALRAVGVVHRVLGEPREAIAPLTEAVSLQVDDVRQRAAAQNDLGNAVYSAGDSQRALSIFEEALAGERAVHDRRNEAQTLSNVGAVLQNLGEMHRALEAYEQSLAQADPDDPFRAVVIGNIGTAHFNMGDVTQAKEYLTRALDLRRAAGDKRGQAQMLRALGNLNQETGELQKALEYLNESLALRRATGDRSGEAYTLQILGSCYDKLGEPRVALDYFDQARRIHHDIGNRSDEADTLMHMSATYGRMRQRSVAIGYGEAALRLMQQAGNSRGEGEALTSLGDLYRGLGEWPRALDQFTRALPLVQRSSDVIAEAQVTGGIGSAQIDLGRAGEAVGNLRRALALASRAGNRLAQVEFEYELGRADVRLGDLAAASDALKRAVATAEAVRSSVAGAELRAHYFATARKAHELLIDTLMRLDAVEPGRGYREAAFEVSERSRARSLLELLSESHADLREGVDPELLDRARTVESSLAAKTAYVMQARGRSADEAEIAAAQRELDALTIAFREVEAEMRAKSPAYAALTQPSIVTIADAQRTLLDPDTLLLEYALGDERSYVWAIASDSVDVRVLPARAIIEAAVARAYRRVSTNDPAAVVAVDRSLKELGRLLLGSVKRDAPFRRVVVVADDSLEYIPFGALLTQAGSSLLQQMEVVTLSSMSTLAELRTAGARRRPPSKLAAVIADPVFDEWDPRVAYTGPPGARAPRAERTGGEPSLVRRSATEAGLSRLARLQFSRQEADIIRSLVAPGERLTALDFDASRDAILNPALGDYRIVHIATHGLINSQHPELSGLVLSLVDRQGRAQDGFVQSHELYTLRLSADVVVLSACQTALGEQVRGEGLISLTRPFMHAGVPRVVASLWQVSDRATAALMTLFYQGMMRDHLSAAAALRRAQLTLRRTPRWSRPYFWAGFTIQGDWR